MKEFPGSLLKLLKNNPNQTTKKAQNQTAINKTQPPNHQNNKTKHNKSKQKKKPHQNARNKEAFTKAGEVSFLKLQTTL